MKFGKSLCIQVEEAIPEWRDKFLSYKDLKKRLKQIHGGDHSHKRKKIDAGVGLGLAGDKNPADDLTEEEIDFINLLEDELEKFNAFFVEKEEEYVIRFKELQDLLGRAEDSTESTARTWKEIVDFHGEMVLLENYSALNYTGLVKILKKYDKRTGTLMRLPFIQRVLAQPFFATDTLFKLVKECEVMLDRLFSRVISPSLAEAAVTTVSGCGRGSYFTATDGEQLPAMPVELSEIKHMEGFYMKSTLSALRALKEIRSGSSSVSAFSLPPIENPMNDTWKKVLLLEQLAK